VDEKFPTKTKPAIAKNALAVSSLALRALMQAGETFQNVVINITTATATKIILN